MDRDGMAMSPKGLWKTCLAADRRDGSPTEDDASQVITSKDISDVTACHRLRAASNLNHDLG